ncbi:MAG: type III pantothenate kinase [Lamprobacter sp.]|uniref:type III pantothenate kinase n=1 Tax=Lamprobacter sp. TaxID=3100796 RepID=UPI002B25CA86|nr:type III pantothenate kinase [Lamprobacter sp.]MEA3638418.1 type III pantothenate kinase [Lamprobacter sp.]
MKLLVEIGNTSLKWAPLEAHAHAPGPMTAARHSAALPIDVLASWEQLEFVEAVLVASVGPASVVEAVSSAASAYWQCPLDRIETQAEAWGVQIAYQEPARLGVDRFLALIGAHWLTQRPDLMQAKPDSSPTAMDTADAGLEPPRRPDEGCATLIIDAGTAITFDALLANGRHRGGQIMPGITLLRESLLQGTRLPPHQAQDHHDPWGLDTGPAISAASLQAPAALAERLGNRLQQETGKVPRLIITGGDANRLLPLLRREAYLQPDLVLLGLARFA